MEKKRTVLLIGGPEMGKTNFLGRFWGTVYQQTGHLRADGLPEDIEHLKAISTDLASGKFSPRTPQNEHWHCVIPIQGISNDKAFTGGLVVPDCSGEEWRRIYRNREWSAKWEDLIPETWGCLLFIRPSSDKICTPLDWMQCWSFFGSTEHFPEGPDAGRVDGQVPTQVELVDWLQCLRQAITEKVGGMFRPRVGIVIAAWDRLPKEQQERRPDCYLEENFPLFHQFIHTNDPSFEFASFGASVAGGDLDLDAAFREKYLQSDPHMAGYVIHDLMGTLDRSPDHTLPVAWAMGLDIRAALQKGGGQ